MIIRELVPRRNCSVSQKSTATNTLLPWWSAKSNIQTSHLVSFHHRPSLCLPPTTLTHYLITDNAISIQRLHKLSNLIKAKEVIFQDDIHNLVTQEISQQCAALVRLQEALSLLQPAWMNYAGVIISVMDECVIRSQLFGITPSFCRGTF